MLLVLLILLYLTLLLNTQQTGNYFADASFLDILFAEELGLVLEVTQDNVQHVMDTYSAANVPCALIGHSLKQKQVSFTHDKFA